MTLEMSDNSNPRLLRAMELISNLCDDHIDGAQLQELESLVLDDPQIRDVYLRQMHLDAGFHHYSAALGNLPDIRPDLISERANDGESHLGSGNGMEESMVLPALRDTDTDDGVDDGTEIVDELAESPPPLQDRIDKAQKRPGAGPFLKGGAAAVLVLGVGIAFYFILHAAKAHTGKPETQLAITTPVTSASPERVAVVPPVVAPILPPSTPVATVTCVANPVWGEPDMPPAYGNFIAGQTLAIASGDVQLAFHRGGGLVVEGPASVEFVSDTQIKLLHGRIVATIPGGGLTVDCPNGAITDLGTQFGIDVNPNGATEVQVFQGRVAASLKSSATTQGTKDMLLAVGQAAVLTRDALAVDPNGAVPQQFVRSLVNDNVKSLDVTDLICGGDGTSHLRGIGINANTGAVGNFPASATRYGNGKYQRITSHPVLDGAFIPDGRPGAIVVDSAGDKFDFSPADGSSYDYIFTGGKIPWRWPQGLPTVLDGVDYSTPDHSIVFMHANNALTLDLNAIRRLYPDRRLTSFNCRVGDSAIPDANVSTTNPPVFEANARVLVNGLLRAEKPHVSNRSGSTVMEVPLRSDDRFLTLATTNNGKGIGNDWLLWVDAKFELSSNK